MKYLASWWTSTWPNLRVTALPGGRRMYGKCMCGGCNHVSDKIFYYERDGRSYQRPLPQ